MNFWMPKELLSHVLGLHQRKAESLEWMNQKLKMIIEKSVG